MVAERFDIQAKVPEGATKEQVPEMLQALLIERFQLKIHHQPQETNVCVLTVGRDGSHMNEARPDAGKSSHPTTAGPGERVTLVIMPNDIGGANTISTLDRDHVSARFPPRRASAGLRAIVSILTGLLFGLPPALRFTRLDLNRALKEEGSIFGARFRQSRLRAALLGAQAAVSLLLLLVSGDIVTRFHEASVSNPGFDMHNTYVLEAEGEEEGRVDLWAIRDRLATLPEIAGTAIGDVPSGDDDGTLPMTAGKWSRRTFSSTVSDGYFETVGMRFERGRGFTRPEISSHAAVAVITESTARRCWPQEDPLGKLLSLTFRGEKGESRSADFEVIGVVNDVRQADLIHIDPVRVYIPAAMQPNPNHDLIFHIRADRARTLAAVQSTIEALDPNLLPGLKLYSLEDGNIAAIQDLYGVMATAGGILSVLALTLAVVGIYGVTAFLASQQTRKIGIRVALGATTQRIVKAIVMPGLRPVLPGMAIGFAAAVGVNAWDHSTDFLPETLLHRVFGGPGVGAEVALMLAAAALASLIPARRALRVDPMRALRHE